MDTIAVAGAMILECSVRMTQRERYNFQDLIITQGKEERCSQKFYFSTFCMIIRSTKQKAASQIDSVLSIT